MSIKARLLLALIPTTILLLAALILITFKMSEQTILLRINDAAFNLARSYSDEFDVLAETTKTVTEAMSTTLDTVPTLNDSMIRELIRKNLEANPSIYGSTVSLLPDATPLGYYAPYYYRGPQGLKYRVLEKATYDYTHWKWFTQPIREGRGSWGEPYYDEGGGDTLMTTYSTPIRHKGKVIGVVTADLNLDGLVDRIRSLKVGESGYAFIVSKDGHFIAHPNKQLLSAESIWDQAGTTHNRELGELIRMLKAGEASSLDMVFPFTGKESWVITMPIKSTEWMLAIIYPKEEILSPLNRLRHTVILISLATLVILVVLIMWISSSTASPLTRLVKQTERYADGHFDERLEDRRGSREVRKLSRAFNVMGQAIERMIRELKESGEARLALQNELHEKEKERMASEKASQMKSEFIAYVSHELRSPLTVIKGFASTMYNDNEGFLEKEDLMEFYEAIESSADRLLVMINELLDTSRLEAGCDLQLAVKEIDLGEELGRIARMLKHYKYFTEAHQFEIDVPADLPRLVADPDKVAQVISNFVTNAIKYSPEGGVIRLSARGSDGLMLISVSDQGVGMDPEQAAKLFGRYERI